MGAKRSAFALAHSFEYQHSSNAIASLARVKNTHPPAYLTDQPYPPYGGGSGWQIQKIFSGKLVLYFSLV